MERVSAADHFRQHLGVYWANLNRVTNLLVILNVSFFFLSGLVTEQGYWFTWISLGCLALVHVASLVPLGYCDRLGFYLACLALEAVAIYFFVASVVYWVRTSGVAMTMGR